MSFDLEVRARWVDVGDDDDDEDDDEDAKTEELLSDFLPEKKRPSWRVVGEAVH